MLRENNRIRTDVLERMHAQMDSIGITNELLLSSEGKSPVDILVCSHSDIPGMPDGVLGQYFFTGAEAAENVFYFNSLITIKTDLTDEEKKIIGERLDEINKELVCGHFAIYPEAGLIYKLSYPLTECLAGDDLFELIDTAVAHGIVFLTNYGERLLG